MASIQERKTADGSIRYRVQVRVRGFPTVSETFERKTDAKRWAAKTENEIRDRKYFRSLEAQRHTLKDAIQRYLKLPSIKSRKSYKDKRTQLGWWEREIGDYLLIDVTPSVIAEKRDKLLNEKTRRNLTRAPASVNRFLAVLSHMFTVAVKEWGWLDFNPVQNVSKPREPRGRDRYLTDDERERLVKACRESKSKYLYPVVMLALTTGMRRSEVLNLKWQDISLPNKRITLRETKNREIRSVPLVGEAEILLKDLSKIRRIDTDLVFPTEEGDKPFDLKTPWAHALKRAKIEDFRFHDLRHSCASYLAMSGATLAEIAAVLGHKTLAMVKRYSHLSETHTAEVVMRMNKKFLGGSQ
jgi:integrase